MTMSRAIVKHAKGKEEHASSSNLMALSKLPPLLPPSIRSQLWPQLQRLILQLPNRPPPVALSDSESVKDGDLFLRKWIVVMV